MIFIFLLMTLGANNFGTDISAPEGNFQPDLILSDTTYTVFEYDSIGMTLLGGIDSFDFIFYPESVATVKEVALNGNYRFMINGTFFDGERLHAGHAGWLKIMGKNIARIRDEDQLSHILICNPSEQIYQIVSREEFVPDLSTSTIEFQTGPLVVDNNRVARTAIEKSINGMSEYKRTLLAICDSRDIYFITVRKETALDDLAEYLLRLPVFQDRRLDVINLDGGPSVAFYSRYLPALNFNCADHLPILLGVK